MTDPRLEIIGHRLSGVKRIIAVSSGKGGVGKSVVATTLALALKEGGFQVGLLDLDFTSPSTHVILGVEGLYPEEEYGIKPPQAYGMSYMSITYYALDKPAPLRGADVSDAIIEMMAITRWEQLDFLIIDMPPGMGDATLDMVRLVKEIGFIVVSTPSRLAYETVRKQLILLSRLRVPVLGVIENMVMNPSSFIRGQVEKEGASYLGEIGYDGSLEDALGDIEKLKATKFYKAISEISESLG
ncbi:MAG TPA: P-loop NTPase [Patescibacteria group bacterium]|nr:P-loop NTPase [Patescibacteria group bacterium]